MTWRYRVMKERVGDDTRYFIAEFYSSGGYNEVTDVASFASYYEDLGTEIAREQGALSGVKWQLEEMLEALSMPVIDVAELGK